MNGDPIVFEILSKLGIQYQYVEHPESPTIEIARQYWGGIEAQHCKNLFFRNYKGNQHYLVILDSEQNMAIHNIEKMLKQGKISFASEQRMMKYLGLRPGSVSPFGLVHDTENHVHVFFDENLRSAKRISFHPNLNTATLILDFTDFLKYMDEVGNAYEFLKLY